MLFTIYVKERNSVPDFSVSVSSIYSYGFRSRTTYSNIGPACLMLQRPLCILTCIQTVFISCLNKPSVRLCFIFQGKRCDKKNPSFSKKQKKNNRKTYQDFRTHLFPSFSGMLAALQKTYCLLGNIRTKPPQNLSHSDPFSPQPPQTQRFQSETEGTSRVIHQ